MRKTALSFAVSGSDALYWPWIAVRIAAYPPETSKQADRLYHFLFLQWNRAAHPWAAALSHRHYTGCGRNIGNCTDRRATRLRRSAARLRAFCSGNQLQ